MRYTLLRVTDVGIVACAQHMRRLGLVDPRDEASAAGEAVARAVRHVAPGVWAVWVDDDGTVRILPRRESRLVDGMPSRWAVSPMADGTGPVSKPPPPGPYDAVRRHGVATLLTTRDGSEILEACSAAVLGWDGASIVRVRDERPRVWSTAEAAVRERLDVRAATIPAGGDMPLLLVNAVRGTCAISVPGRAGFPARARSLLDGALRAATAWPDD